MSDLAIFTGDSSEEKQYIVFRINKEFFGIDIAQINSIILVPKITKVPKMPEYFKGLISLRGSVLPVINLRKKMNLEDKEFDKDTRIIILNTEDGAMMGVIVDEVNEVTNISNDDIKEPSPFLKNEDSLISGVGKKDDQLISIFEVEKITA